MKKNDYQAPKAIAIELEIEDAVLQFSSSYTTNGVDIEDLIYGGGL